ncbi:MAG TPA: Rieske 2Fe-2S domain-containing protein [Burkholderiaceae bacterium]
MTGQAAQSGERERLPVGWRWVEVCDSGALADGGDGARFEMPGDEMVSGFAVRSEGTVYAYLNQCQHIPVELDWQLGKFFDASGLYLVCATHGATYRASDGVCVEGPCVGRRLRALRVAESGGSVWVAMQSGNE